MEDTVSTLPTVHVGLTADIVSAYVSNNSVPIPELANLIASVHSALLSLDSDHAALAELELEKPSAAQIRKSVSNKGIVSFIDGKTYQSLKRHLGGHGLDGAGYRERYGLPANYPMTSPAYSARRSELARNLGLGRLRKKAAAPSPVVVAAPELVAAEPKRRGRPRTKTTIAAE